MTMTMPIPRHASQSQHRLPGWLRRCRGWHSGLLLMLLMLLLGGCATPADDMDLLNSTLSAYGSNIRWGQYDAAYDFHRWESGARPDVPANLKNIRVTGYNVEKSKFDKDKMEMEQSVAIRYYNTETSRENSIRMQQHWQYSKEQKRWYLLSPPPAFQ